MYWQLKRVHHSLSTWPATITNIQPTQSLQLTPCSRRVRVMLKWSSFLFLLSFKTGRTCEFFVWHDWQCDIFNETDPNQKRTPYGTNQRKEMKMRMFWPSALEEDTTPLVMTLNFAFAKHDFTEETYTQMLNMNGWPTESFYITCCVSAQLLESLQAAVFTHSVKGECL